MKTRIATGLWLLAPGFFLPLSGCAQVERTATVTRRTFEVFTPDVTLKAAQAMENERLPDERRKGINKLVQSDFGRRDPYTKRYAQIASSDPDFLVRATAIRALNRSRYKPATSIFIEALKDKEAHAVVRLEAAKALANIPDPNAATALVDTVNNAAEDRDVRIAAADALRHYKQIEVARALASKLRGNDFGLAWQSRKSLENLTGRDLRYDQTAWLAYLSGPTKPFG
jgi:HEAT repeat protein